MTLNTIALLLMLNTIPLMMLNATPLQRTTEALEKPVTVMAAPTSVPAMTDTRTPTRNR